eukprot:2284553-Pyramimonas_sp.AAC.2
MAVDTAGSTANGTHARRRYGEMRLSRCKYGVNTAKLYGKKSLFAVHTSANIARNLDALRKKDVRKR